MNMQQVQNKMVELKIEETVNALFDLAAEYPYEDEMHDEFMALGTLVDEIKLKFLKAEMKYIQRQTAKTKNS